MQFNVPQFIDIEDRIVGPLTARQLGWLALGGVALLVLWNVLEFGTFIVVAIFIVILVVALAFFKPHGMSLAHFVVASFFFVSRPKIYTWKRNPKKRKLERKRRTKKQTKIEPKNINNSKIEEISKILDK